LISNIINLEEKDFLPVPSFRLIEPLVSVDSDLGAERFGQDKHVSNDSRIGAENEKNNQVSTK